MSRANVRLAPADLQRHKFLNQIYGFFYCLEQSGFCLSLINLHVSMKLMGIYLSELLRCGIPNHLISGELIIPP